MKVISKFLEEWDLEIIWTVLLAAVCAIALALTTQQDADAGPANPPRQAQVQTTTALFETRLPPEGDEARPAASSGLGIVIASQGNLALRQIRQEMQQDLPVRLRPTLSQPAEPSSAGADAPELLAARQTGAPAGGITSAGRAPSARFR
jgi:hypothetical protein